MSNFVADLLERIFPKPSENGVLSTKPFLIELLVRTDRFKADFNSFEKVELDALKQAILTDLEHKSSADHQNKVSRHQFQGSNGILIDLSGLDEKPASFLFEHLKDVILENGYRVQQADRQHFARTNQVERRDRYYLKPNLHDAEPPFDQKWGNLMLEFIVDDRTPRALKLQSNTYSDRQYRPASTFDTLLHILFGHLN